MATVIAPIIGFGAGISFYIALILFYRVLVGYKSDAYKEYQRYVDRLEDLEIKCRSDYCKDMEEYKKMERICMPYWFNQEKYAKKLLTYISELDRTYANITLHQWCEGDLPYDDEYGLDKTDILGDKTESGLPSKKYFQTKYFYNGRNSGGLRAIEDRELCNFFMIPLESLRKIPRYVGVGRVIMRLFEDDPLDEEIQQYIRYYHDDFMLETREITWQPFVAYRYLLPINKDDIRCKPMSLKEYNKTCSRVKEGECFERNGAIVLFTISIILILIMIAIVKYC